MLSTLTYAVRVDASPDQSQTLSDTCAAYLDCCNMVSKVAWEHRTISQKTLHQLVYRRLRDEYHVGAQMAQSSIIRVIGNYRTIKTMHGSPWAASQPEYLVEPGLQYPQRRATKYQHPQRANQAPR